MQLNGLLGVQHDGTAVKAMRDDRDSGCAVRRMGTGHLGRLKLGVATSAREEAPLSGVKIE